MDRLTKRIDELRGTSKDTLTGAYCRGEFEATACVDKLADYEDLEEQGMLLRLPCKVGDTFYTIIESKVIHLRFDDCKKNPYAGGIDLYCTNVKNRCDYRWIHLPCEKFYTTQAEAEEALERMKGNNDRARSNYIHKSTE